MDNRTIDEVKRNEDRLINKIELLEKENQDLKEELKKLHNLKEKEQNEEKQRTIIGLFLYVNEVTDNLERIKNYLKSLK